MAGSRSAWGIDIGNRALKAVKLSRDGSDAIRVEDFDFIEHETILSHAGDNRDDLIRHAIQTFVGRKSIKGSTVAVGVSGQSSFARFIKLPPVEAKQIPQIVKFEAIQQIPFPLDEVEWAYQLFQSAESPDIECGIFAMRKELVNEWVGLFTQSDLNVQAVQTNPLAVYNAVQRDGRLASGTAMVIDVGAENTDLIIASDNSIWLRSIPIGGNSFTETIQKAFKLTPQKAEDLKRDAASSKYYRQILQAMRPVFADLVAEIQRSIGFYGSVNREHKIEKIIALGGTFRMPSLPKYLQQNLQLEVERPDNFMAGMPEDSKTAAALTENVLSLHAAYGLALQAMGETKVDSSLLPTAIRRKKMWKDKNKWFATAAGLCIAGAGVAAASYVLNSAAFTSQASARTQSEDIQRQATNLDGQWKEVQGGGGSDLQTIRNVNSLLAYRDLWPNILSDIMASVPPPPKDLAEAMATGNADAIRKTPREQRKVIRIDSMQSRYFHDLGFRLRSGELGQFVTTDFSGGFTAPSTFDQPPQVDPTAVAGAAVERGYLVYLRLLTPYDKAEETLVRAGLLQKLNAVGANVPKAKYAFRRAEFVTARPLSDDPELLGRIRADVAGARSAATAIVAATPFTPSGGGTSEENGGGGGGGEPMPAPQNYQPPAGQAGDADALRDPLTSEDMSRDKVIEVIFAIVLDPVPPAAAAPGANASATPVPPNAP